MQKVQPKNKAELLGIIEVSINSYGSNCDLNFIDTSLITDMSDLFCGLNFNGDISCWDVSMVESMRYMFCDSVFDNDISCWNVSNVKYMNCIFLDSALKDKAPEWYFE